MTTFFTIAGMVILTLIVARFAITFTVGLWVDRFFGGKSATALTLATVASWIAMVGIIIVDWSIISEHVTFH